MYVALSKPEKAGQQTAMRAEEMKKGGPENTGLQQRRCATVCNTITEDATNERLEVLGLPHPKVIATCGCRSGGWKHWCRPSPGGRGGSLGAPNHRTVLAAKKFQHLPLAFPVH